MVGLEFGKPPLGAPAGRVGGAPRARNGLFSQADRRCACTTATASSPRWPATTARSSSSCRRSSSAIEVDRFLDAFTDVMDDAHRARGLVWEFASRMVKGARSREGRAPELRLRHRDVLAHEGAHLVDGGDRFGGLDAASRPTRYRSSG